MSHQVAAAHKADITLRHAWGPDERNRMARMAAWTGDHPDQPPENNPERREAAYSKTERARAARFLRHAKMHPEDDPADNPDCHPALRRRN